MPGRYFFKLVEVHHHHVDQRDSVLGKRPHVFGIGANGQHPASHPRMDGLQPAIQHLGKSGEFGHFAHRHAGGFELAGRAAGGDNLARPGRATPCANSTTPVLSVTLMSARWMADMALVETFSTIVNVSYPVTLIPGDGIGPEVAEAAMRAVDATGVSIELAARRFECEHHLEIRAGAAAACN